MPYMPKGKRGHPPFPVKSQLCMHSMQQRFTWSDVAMAEALYEMSLFRGSTRLGCWIEHLHLQSALSLLSIQLPLRVGLWPVALRWSCHSKWLAAFNTVERLVSGVNQSVEVTGPQ